jgi:hypothetical protein
MRRWPNETSSLIGRRRRPGLFVCRHASAQAQSEGERRIQRHANVGQTVKPRLGVCQCLGGLVLRRETGTSTEYWQVWNRLRAKLGGKFHAVFDTVSRAMARTPRSSSLVENLNSRLRNYFTLRRHLGRPISGLAAVLSQPSTFRAQHVRPGYLSHQLGAPAPGASSLARGSQGSDHSRGIGRRAISRPHRGCSSSATVE